MLLLHLPCLGTCSKLIQLLHVQNSSRINLVCCFLNLAQTFQKKTHTSHVLNPQEGKLLFVSWFTLQLNDNKGKASFLKPNPAATLPHATYWLVFRPALECTGPELTFKAPHLPWCVRWKVLTQKCQSKLPCCSNWQTWQQKWIQT